MWITKLQLFTVLSFACFNWSYGVERDIEVHCLDAQATTIKDGGVIANCAFSGLTRTTTVGPWLFQLADVLQAVNMSHNHFKRVSTFPLLPRVLSLTLERNSIRQIEPLAFSGLENLRNLDLSNNRINGDSLKGVLVGKKVSDHFEPLPIRILFLSHNDINTLEPETFSHLQYLQDLHLDFNPLIFDEKFSRALQQLPELTMLNLAGSELTSLPKDAFSGIKLKSLWLNGNKLTQVPDLSELGGSLQLLNINQNPILELNSNSFSGLRSLNEIVASGMPKLSTIESGTFSSLENIHVISCSNNPKLSNIDEAAFWDKNKTRITLQKVYLNDNALPRIKKDTLPWMKLSEVTLDGNQWMCDCRLHWLANFIRSRNTTVDKLMDVKCWEPTWMNGTQMVFWNIDLKGRHENFPCLEERKAEEERQQKLLELERTMITVAPTSAEVTEEGSLKFYHLIIIAAFIVLVVLIGSIIAFNKYRNYRPIYNVEKMSSPMLNEMKNMKGSLAEKSQLVR